MTTAAMPTTVRDALSALLAVSPRVSAATVRIVSAEVDGVAQGAIRAAVIFDNGCVWRNGVGEGFGVSDDDLADEIAPDGDGLWSKLAAAADRAERVPTEDAIGEAGMGWALNRADA